MIKNYIFDFGNVLAEFYPDKLTAPHISDEETNKLVREVVFDRLYWDKLDMGTITDEEVKEGIKSRVPESLKDVALTVYDNWINNLTPVKGMQKLISDMHKRGEKMYLLSNISIGFAENYKNVKWIEELFSCFEGLVFSGVIHKVKPDEEIFKHLLGKYNLKSEECIFVDDSKINIEGAEKAGIKGYLFDGNAEKLREELGI